MIDLSYAIGILAAFSRLGLSAIVLDHDGRVVDLNDAAKKFLGTCIRIVDGRLGGMDRNSNEHFQSLITAATQPQVEMNAGQDSFVLLPGAGVRSVIAYAAPIPPVGKDEAVIPGTIILLVSQDGHREPDTRLLEALFAFTPAEMRLAVALARGLDLQSIAQTHNVTIGTLRVHLKSIFEKTNTSRQAELILLLARLSIRLT
jgi:DNA-binding CsgD family transcriptional regulator